MDDYRFLIDEASLSLDREPGAIVEIAFDRLSDQIQLSRDRGELVGILSAFDVLEVQPGLPLYELLTGDALSRDCRVRAYGLLDKCARFDKDPDFFISPDVEVNGIAVTSFALATIGTAYRMGHATGALTLVPVSGPGEVALTDSGGSATAFIVVDEATRSAFYRSVFAIENVQEGDFLSWAVLAFPQLRFVEGLNFR